MLPEFIETALLACCFIGAFVSKDHGKLSQAKDYPITPDIFRLFQQGDHQATQQLVSNCYDGMVAYLWAQTGCQETAQDLAQECFLRLYQNRKKIYDEARVLPWLYQTARRLIVEEKRREARQQESISKRDQLLHKNCDHNRDKTLSLDLGRIVSTVLKDLKPEEQQLISLRYFSGLKIKDISETLDMPQGSVGVKLGRALKQFEKALAQRGFSKEDLL